MTSPISRVSAKASRLPRLWTLRSNLVCMLAVASVLASVSLAQGSSEISLSWTDNSENEKGFEVERKEQDQDFALVATLGQDVESFTDVSITPGLEYQYRVRAFNDFGDSGYTNVLETTVDNTAPQIISLQGGSPNEVLELEFQRGDSVGPILIEIADAETAVSSLEFELTPSDSAVVPEGSLSYFVDGNTVSLSIDTVLAQVGSSDLSFIVSDGVEAAEASIRLTVNPNEAPRVTAFGGPFDVVSGATFGPRAFTIIDDSSVGNIVVSARSSDSSMIPNENIYIGGVGFERSVTVDVPHWISGDVSITVTASDGVYETNSAFALRVASNSAPRITSGFEENVMIPAGGRVTGIPFSIADNETSLEVSVSSSNPLLFRSALFRLKGTGTDRTLDLIPTPRQSGTATVRVSVSDGLLSTTKEFMATVAAPDLSVELIEFRVEGGLAVAEVESRPGAIFTLQRTFALAADIWEVVENVEVSVRGDSTLLVDPTPVDQPVCYRVFASE